MSSKLLAMGTMRVISKFFEVKRVSVKKKVGFRVSGPVAVHNQIYRRRWHELHERRSEVVFWGEERSEGWQDRIQKNQDVRDYFQLYL